MKTQIKTPQVWYREVNIRKMTCLLCGNTIDPLSKILTAHTRGKTSAMCNACEKSVPHERLEINENPISGNLPHSSYLLLEKNNGKR